MAKISNLDFDQLITSGDRTYIATWSFSQSHLDSYTVQFQYYTQSSDIKKNSNGVYYRERLWIDGSENTTKNKQAVYTAPENASKVRVRVKPTSVKTKPVNNTTTYWWSSEWSAYKEASIKDSYVPDSPGVPTVTVSEGHSALYVTVSCDNLDAITSKVQFQFVINDASIKYVLVDAVLGKASYKLPASVGTEYRVRARADNIVIQSDTKFQFWSEWSDYSETYQTQPSAPLDLKCIVKSETSVYLTWTKPAVAESYEIQYAITTEEILYESGASFKSDTSETVGRIITSLNFGSLWYFRIRALNASGVPSVWSPIISTVLGTSPFAPTTWSSLSTVALGDAVNLYWVHNAEDGSSLTQSNIQISINGTVVLDETIENTKDEYGEYSVETNVYELDTSTYLDSSELLWRVRTMGVTDEYGEWSMQRSIRVYEKPMLYLDILDGEGGVPSTVIDKFPIYIKCLSVPETQTPIGYSVAVIATESYYTTADTGTNLHVKEGDEVYTAYMDVDSGNMELVLTAGNIDLQNGMTYRIVGTVNLDSGLTAKGETEVTVAWAEERYNIEAVINYNDRDLTAYIIPYCTFVEAESMEYLVDNNGDYLTDRDGNFLIDMFARIDNTEDDPEEVRPDLMEFELAEGVTLSVYRREANGRFTEIATGVENSGAATVTDPHPCLDYARYRIVARSDDTGAISYEDLPGFPTGETSVVIQWDEEWIDFNSNEEGRILPTWGGSMVKLPYNIDVSENNSVDVSLVEYIGRERPVSYYGTQLGENPSWSCVIPKEDEDTLYQLRRLSVYQGDVYVREPSGTGFWAQIGVSFNRKHDDLTIPITLNIKPVEGGL